MYFDNYWLSEIEDDHFVFKIVTLNNHIWYFDVWLSKPIKCLDKHKWYFLSCDQIPLHTTFEIIVDNSYFPWQI